MVVEYRLTGGAARRINNALGAGTVKAGDWYPARVTGIRPHSSRNEDVLLGTVLETTFDGAVYGDGFGCWRKLS